MRTVGVMFVGILAACASPPVAKEPVELPVPADSGAEVPVPRPLAKPLGPGSYEARADEALRLYFATPPRVAEATAIVEHLAEEMIADGSAARAGTFRQDTQKKHRYQVSKLGASRLRHTPRGVFLENAQGDLVMWKKGRWEWDAGDLIQSRSDLKPGGGGHLSLWDVTDGTTAIIAVEDEWLADLVAAPKGRFVIHRIGAAKNGGEELIVLERNGLADVHRITMCTAPLCVPHVRDVIASKDGEVVATTAADRHRVWSMATGRELVDGAPIHAIAFSPTENVAFVVRGGNLERIDLNPGSQGTVLAHVSVSGLSPCKEGLGKEHAVTDPDHPDQPLAPLPRPPGFERLYVSPDGSMLLYFGARLPIFDALTLKRTHEFQAPKGEKGCPHPSPSALAPAETGVVWGFAPKDYRVDLQGRSMQPVSEEQRGSAIKREQIESDEWDRVFESKICQVGAFIFPQAICPAKM